MTIVISIRLDPTNSREKRALQTLQNWNKKGFGNRHTIVEALLNLDHERANDLLSRFDRIEKLIMDLQTNENGHGKVAQAHSNTHADLTEEFKDAMKISIRKGIGGNTYLPET